MNRRYRGQPVRYCETCGGRALNRRCSRCLKALREGSDYRRRTLARDGRDCALCPRPLNAALAWAATKHDTQLGRFLAIPDRRYVEVDHIQTVAERPDLVDDPNNHWVLCQRKPTHPGRLGWRKLTGLAWLAGILLCPLNHHGRKTRRDVARMRGKTPPRYSARQILLALLAAVLGWTYLLQPLVGALLTTAATAPAIVALAAALTYGRWRLYAHDRKLRHLHNSLDSIFRWANPTKNGAKPRRQPVTARRWRKVPGTRLPVYAPQQVTIRYPSTFAAHDTDKRMEVTRAVQSVLDGHYAGTWTPGQVTYRRLHLPDLVTDIDLGTNPDQLVYGVTEDGPLTWDVSKAPHALITGPTGSGKSVTITSIAAAALHHGWEVTFLDPKQIEMLAFEHRRGVKGVHVEQTPMEEAISATLTEQQRRYRAIRNREAARGTFPRHLLVVDEVAHLIEQGRRGTRGNADPQVLTDLADLARLARSAGIHLLVGLQRPDARFLSGEARDNYTYRVVCGVLGTEGWRMVFGSPEAREMASPHKGRVLAAVNGLTPERGQVRYIPNGSDLGASEEDQDAMNAALPPLVPEAQRPAAPEPARTAPPL